MKLEKARSLALQIIESMGKSAIRAEVAGSIRREKEEVGDLEIVAISRWVHQPGLFEDTPKENQLHSWALEVERAGRLQWIKTGTPDIERWQPKPEGKYWRGFLPKQDIKLDLFLTTRPQWGVIQLIRTGSAEFSKGFVTFADFACDLKVKDGWLQRKDGALIETPEERDVFLALGVDYVEPKDRTEWPY